MPLAAQTVQSINDLFLIRIFNHANNDVNGDTKNDSRDSCSNLQGKDKGVLHDSASRIERTLSRDVSSWVSTVARLLQEQWPRQDEDTHEHSESHGDEISNDEIMTSKHVVDGTDSATDTTACFYHDEYYRRLIVHHEESYPRYSLACSYILLKQSSKTPTKTIVLGHGRLTECYESAGGNAVAATYILIDPKHRGEGYGRTIMYLLEKESLSKERLGCQYHFVYLWCKISTAPFYQRSGYLPCRNRVSLQRPCLKALTATSVQSLESVLQRHQRHRCAVLSTTKTETVNEGNPYFAKKVNDKTDVQRSKNSSSNSSSNNNKKLETVVLLPSSEDNRNKTEVINQPVAEEDVWLRKRLIDHVESDFWISVDDRRKEIESYVISINNGNVILNDNSTNTIVSNEKGRSHCYRYSWIPNVPWQMQIGPTCGLTAIRMILDFFHKPDAGQGGEGSIIFGQSLLAIARERGYTNDGEMFDANHLSDLMKHQLLACGTSNILWNRAATAYGSMDTILVQTKELSSLSPEEMDCILRKRGLWILPYDSNPRTKLPGKFQGKHAHWGIVVGILYSWETTNTTAKGVNIEENPAISSDCQVNLIVQHSLSSKWAIAPIEKWFDSNNQLVSVNEDKFVVGNEQKLNLKNKIIQVLPS